MNRRTSRNGRTTTRRLHSLCAALALTVAACTGATGAAPGPPSGSPTVEAMAREVGRDVLRALARGYVAGASGDVLLVTKPWSVMGTWGSGVRGPEDPRTSHAVPWSYLTRVPIILYGPGHVRSGRVVERPVDVTDLPPTFADLMGFEFDAPDGRALREALPRAEVRGAPRLIVLLVHDGGGWNVLERWPDAWPAERELMRRGTVYLNATVGSAPPVTAPVHANMGTGAYPTTHGMPEIVVRRPDGTIGEAYFDRGDPRMLKTETLADAWDRAEGNRPWVGLVAFESWHLGMMGKGAAADGGDRDVAVLWDRDEGRPWTNEELYDLPEYVPDREALERRLAELDAADGTHDGAWMGNDLAEERLAPGTPAFVDYVGDTLGEILRREPVGRDDLTDLLFINLKALDYGGHIWNMESEEQRQTLLAQDRAVGELVGLLDELVGRGRYVLAVTADHGQTPNPAGTGGMRVDKFKVAEAVDAHFGRDLVETTSPDDLYLRLDVLDEAGIEVADVARLLGSLRVRDVLPDGTDLEAIPREVLDGKAFAAALPGSFVEGLTDTDLLAFGPGPHPEGDLTSPPSIDSLPARPEG